MFWLIYYVYYSLHEAEVLVISAGGEVPGLWFFAARFCLPVQSPLMCPPVTIQPPASEDKGEIALATNPVHA